jgi:hypothetical protein
MELPEDGLEWWVFVKAAMASVSNTTQSVSLKHFW